jgi:protein KRI1
MLTPMIRTRTILTQSLMRVKTRTVKNLLPLSMWPSYARSHASKRETRASTRPAAACSRVCFPPFCFVSPACPNLIRNILTEEHSQSRTLPAPSRTKKAKSNKPVTLHEQRLAAALDVASTRSSSPEAPSPPPTHVAEQAALRAETIAAFHSSAADTGYAAQQEEGGLFTLREKTKDEVEHEEAEYREYLEREVGPLEKILDLGEEEKAEGWILRKEEEDMHVPLGEADSGKKNKKKKGKKVVEKRDETDQEFLIKCVCSQCSIPHNISDERYLISFFGSYILHRGWIDRSARRVPTYKEITVGASSSKDPGPSVTPSGTDVGADANGGLLEDDEEFDEVAERFESSYNFRFEEPDAAHIPSFPRAVESVRRPTEHAERRQAARERRRERKEAEKAQRREEVKRLKGLKAREVEAKLERIGKEGGWTRSKGVCFPPFYLMLFRLNVVDLGSSSARGTGSRRGLGRG